MRIFLKDWGRIKVTLFAPPPPTFDYTVITCSFIHSIIIGKIYIYLERDRNRDRETGREIEILGILW